MNWGKYEFILSLSIFSIIFLRIRQNRELSIKIKQKLFKDSNNVIVILANNYEEMKTIMGPGRTNIKSLKTVHRIGMTNRYVEVKQGSVA